MTVITYPRGTPNGLLGTSVPAHFYSEEDAELCINYAELILKIVKKYMKS
jgi:HEPN domain-containing protein